MGPKDSEVTVRTGYGEITIPSRVIALWNRHGWPTEKQLEELARDGWDKRREARR